MEGIKVKFDWKSRCPICRGTKLLCGKSKCPVILEYEIYLDSIIPKLSSHIYGNSPPSIFIGRLGYPKVMVGPLLPPIMGDTSYYGTPEKWLNLSIEEILKISSNLVYGRKRLDVKEARKESRFYQDVLDIAISKYSPEVEMEFEGKPVKYIVFSEEVTPFGPAGNIKNISLGTLKIDYRVEKRVSDYDLKAEDGVIQLYLNGLSITAIQRVFSIGGLGTKKERKIVPTRWSITAVDDIIGKYLYKRVKKNPTISEILVYEYSALGNKFIILMLPGNWAYEFLEAWFPGTFWNRYGVLPVIYSDYETFKGRTEYAAIGGCYYASRLATLEYLRKIGRQAIIIVFREVYSDYLFPVGVWIVRECVRSAYKTKPIKFDNLPDAVNYVFKRLKLPASRWINASKLLNILLKQVKLFKYIKSQKDNH